MASKEYEILFRRYNDRLIDPSWQKTRSFRTRLDNLKGQNNNPEADLNTSPIPDNNSQITENVVEVTSNTESIVCDNTETEVVENIQETVDVVPDDLPNDLRTVIDSDPNAKLDIQAYSFKTLMDEYDKLVDSRMYNVNSILHKKQPFTSDNDLMIDIIEPEVEEVVEEEEALPEYYDPKFDLWIERNESKLKFDKKFEYNPLISIIVPVYNVERKYLEDCVKSVFDQVYQNFELILVDDKSTKDETISYLKELENKEKIKVLYKEKNGGISSATNVGFENAKGDYIALLDDDDVLTMNALYEVVDTLYKNKNIDLIYSDEDKIDEEGQYRFFPYFKPDFSPNLIMVNNYICHFLVLKKELVDKTGKMCSELDGCQDYDYVLRCIENTTFNNIYHINKILYHWRAIVGSTALSIDEKPKIKERTLLTKKRMIERGKLNASVEDDGNIKFKSDNELVSVIIPSKDNFEILKECLDSIINKITYKNYEIIIVDNGSKEECKREIEEYISDKSFIKYIYKKMDFNFSKSCQLGVDNSKGKYLLFLNDDIEIVESELFDWMTGYAAIPYIGAVGTKLLYPNSTIIQHCGVMNTQPGPNHYLIGKDDEIVYINYFNRITPNVSAVTGACLMLERNKYNEVGGFDFNFANDYNDIDLCFSLLEKGYYNVVLNNVYSYHHESLTRELAPVRQLLYRTRALYNKHPEFYLSDRYYSDNYDLETNDFRYIR